MLEHVKGKVNFGDIIEGRETGRKGEEYHS
jgi:ribosomal protein S28E/S33